MINYCDIAQLSPFKWYVNTATPANDFDGDWAVNQIKSFERKICYNQKWKVGDETKQQIVSTIPPTSLKVYNNKGVVVKSIAWVLTGTSTDINEKIYEVTVNIDDLFVAGAANRFYFYFEAVLMSASFKWVTEPVEVRTTWANTMVFTADNSDNDWSVYFSTGYRFNFRCEAGVMDFQPDRERFSYVNEIHDIETLSATPFRTFKLYIGTAPGVAPWVVDILNRITCTNGWKLDNKRYETLEGSKWEITRSKGYPLIGAAIDISEAMNQYSLQQSHGALDPGIITGYSFSKFFGSAENIYITEIETIN